MGLFNRYSDGMKRSRMSFREKMRVLLGRGPAVDEEFWEGLEETLILSDMGAAPALSIVGKLREDSTRMGLRDAYEVLDRLNDYIADEFAKGGDYILNGEKTIVLFVGVNGSGKTTTVGKLAKEAREKGRTVVLGSGDTFRAAAIEQLEIWAQRADVPLVARERGSDPCQRVLRDGRACREDGRQHGADRYGWPSAYVGRPDARAGQSGQRRAQARRRYPGVHRARDRCDDRPERPCAGA